MDYRLHGGCLGGRNVIADFTNIQKRERNTVCYMLSTGGGIRDLVDPARRIGFREKLLADIRTAVEEGGARKIFLINHKDCAVYGGSVNFPSETHEMDLHFQHLREAEKIIRREIPCLERISLLFGTLKPGTDGFDLQPVMSRNI